MCCLPTVTDCCLTVSLKGFISMLLHRKERALSQRNLQVLPPKPVMALCAEYEQETR